MFRYVTIIWNERDAAACSMAECIRERLSEVSRDLQTLFECPGIRVLSTLQGQRAADSCQLWNNTGVVLGTLFRTAAVGEGTNGIRLKSLDQHETQLVLDSSGKELVDRYWGRYVAFARDAQRGAKLIVRDPMGGLPCFVCEWHGVTVAFSCVIDCLRTGLFNFTLNWRHVAARVALGALPLRETGLEECMEVHSGSCLRIHGTKAVQTNLWSPTAIDSMQRPLEDINSAASCLKVVTQSCMNSWASCYEDVLLDVSGGLDSAIVAACLAKAPSRPRITAVKFSAQPLPGETRRARRVASRLGFELVEIEVQYQPIAISRILTADPTVNLDLDVGVPELSDQKVSLAHERGALGIFNGDPGDVLFGASTKEFGARDYVHRHGFDIRALRIALDVALLTNRSWWSVLAEALKKPSPGATWVMPSLIMAHRQLAADHARQLVAQHSDLYTPRAETMDCSPPGTSEFLMPFRRGSTYYNPSRTVLRDIDTHPEPVYVLRSQPLVELCLRIPPYIKNAGGRDRWVARRAFWNDTPAEIASTLWKDPAPGATHGMLLRTMASVRELLSDGILMREKMLDRRKLEAALAPGPVRRTSFASEVHDYLIAELWVRRMTSALETSSRPSTRLVAENA